jgi:hypothetical protein
MLEPPDDAYNLQGVVEDHCGIGAGLDGIYPTGERWNPAGVTLLLLLGP